MDLAGLPGWIVDAGPAAGVGLLVVLGVMRGWLVPGSTVDKLVHAERAAVTAQRERADEWRGVAEANRLLAEQATAQTAALSAEIVTQTALLRSIREQAARRRDET